MRRKELFYYVTSASNVMHDVHWCVTVFYQQMENGTVVNREFKNLLRQRRRQRRLKNEFTFYLRIPGHS